MFRHVYFIISELFRACWVTYESNAMADTTLRYTLLCVCYVDAWYAAIYLVACFLYVSLVCTDLSGYVAKCMALGNLGSKEIGSEDMDWILLA